MILFDQITVDVHQKYFLGILIIIIIAFNNNYCHLCASCAIPASGSVRRFQRQKSLPNISANMTTAK